MLIYRIFHNTSVVFYLYSFLFYEFMLGFVFANTYFC